MKFCYLCKKPLDKRNTLGCCAECMSSNPSLQPMYGKIMKDCKGLPHCKKCSKKLVNYYSKLCHSCENKRRYNLGIMNNQGKNNGQFIDGLDKREYPKEFNTELRLSIFKKDSYTCQKCGIYPCNDLTVHHIDYNKNNNKKSNLITLCRKCNSIVNSNRDYWYAYFTYIKENRE